MSRASSPRSRWWAAICTALRMIARMTLLVTVLYISDRTNSAKGMVEISPSGIALVCQVGDPLELTCSITGGFKLWKFTVTIDSGVSQTSMLDVTPDGVSPPVTINSTTFTLSRLSAPDSSPLISRMTINPVSEGLMGVTVSCVDVATTESATTTIQIIAADEDTPMLNLSIRSHSEQFSGNGIILLLEWTVSLSQDYFQHLLENVSIFIVPDPEVTTIFTGNRTLQLILHYNREYRISVTQPGICGQPNQTALIELNYSKCTNAIELIHSSVQVLGYEDPALEGENIILTCMSGLVLNGPNSSTCLGNGEWEPDPREVNCTEKLYPVVCESPQYVLQIKDSVSIMIMTYKEFRNSDFNSSSICCSGIVVIEAHAMNCLEEDLNTTQLRFEGCIISDPVNDRLRDVLISVSCVLILASAAMLILGFIIGHCFSQRYRKSQNSSTDKDDAATANPYRECVDDLELDKNVAYITLRPR